MRVNLLPRAPPRVATLVLQVGPACAWRCFCTTHTQFVAVPGSTSRAVFSPHGIVRCWRLLEQWRLHPARIWTQRRSALPACHQPVCLPHMLSPSPPPCLRLPCFRATGSCVAAELRPAQARNLATAGHQAARQPVAPSSSCPPPASQPPGQPLTSGRLDH